MKGKSLDNVQITRIIRRRIKKRSIQLTRCAMVKLNSMWKETTAIRKTLMFSTLQCGRWRSPVCKDWTASKCGAVEDCFEYTLDCWTVHTNSSVREEICIRNSSIVGRNSRFRIFMYFGHVVRKESWLECLLVQARMQGLKPSPQLRRTDIKSNFSVRYAKNWGKKIPHNVVSIARPQDTCCRDYDDEKK